MTKLLLIFSLFQQGEKLDTIPLVDSNYRLEKSQTLINDELYDDALVQLSMVHPEDSNFMQVGNQLISIFGKMGELRKVDSIATLLKSQGPVTIQFYLQQGNAYTSAEKFDKAITIYEEGLKSFPFNHYLTYNIGYAKSSQQKYAEAILYFQKALETKPFYGPAHQMLGNICAKLGFRTKALLSYATYLALNPDKNWVLVRMNELVNDAYRDEGTIYSAELKNGPFEYYDNLSKSRAAMDERFKSSVEFKAPVSQQLELLMKKLPSITDGEDFWARFYAPVFVSMQQEEVAPDFIYYLLSSTKDENVSTYLEKNEKSKNRWIEIFNSAFVYNRATHRRTALGNTDTYNHWYYESSNLSAIGNKIGEKAVGPWLYYHENGSKSAEGLFAEQGHKQGWWKYYHDNGELSSEQFHDEAGLVQGEIKRYSADGTLENVTSYKDDDLDGEWTAYYACGNVHETYPYSNGIGTGMGKVYYKNGVVKTEYQVSNSMLSGDYITYHQNGEVSGRSTYIEDNLDGLYQGYYYNGEPSEIGFYKEGLADSTWENYHLNGQISAKGVYKNGLKTGEWSYYYSNGTIELKERYIDDGILEGSSDLYSLHGKKYVERIYANHLLVGYKFFAPSGELLHEDSSASGNFEDYRNYFPSGHLKSKGTMVAGVLHGPFTSFHLNGAIHQEGTMFEGGWDGEYKEYDESGYLNRNYGNKDGVSDGYYREFYSNGQVKEAGWVINGKAQQKWKEYWMDGTLKSESYFKNGDAYGKLRRYGPKGKLFEDQLVDKNEQQKIIQYDSLGEAFNVFDLYGAEDDRKATTHVDGSPYFSASYECGEVASNIKFFHPDGSISDEYHIKNTHYEGAHTRKDVLGRITVTSVYENNELEGELNTYFESNRVESTTNYVQGQRQGISKDFYSTGKLEVERNYLDDEPHGIRKQYGPAGELMMIKHYVKDFGPVSYQYQLKNGDLSDTISIQTTGKFQLKTYYSNGKVSAIQNFKDFYFDGDIIYYDEEGQSIRKISYEQGVRHGDTYHYYADGQTKKIVPYQHSEEHGEVREFFENGQLKESTEYQFGVKNGWNRIYNSQGRMVSELYFWNDRIY